MSCPGPRVLQGLRPIQSCRRLLILSLDLKHGPPQLKTKIEKHPRKVVSDESWTALVEKLIISRYSFF